MSRHECQVNSSMSCRVELCCVASWRVASRRVASCRVMSCHVMSCHVTSCHVTPRHVIPWTRGDSNLQTVENRQDRGKTVAVRVRFTPTSVFVRSQNFPEILGQNPETAPHDSPAPKIYRKFWAGGSTASKSCREEPACSHGSLFRKLSQAPKFSRKFLVRLHF